MLAVGLALSGGGANAQENDKSRGATPRDLIEWAGKIQQDYPAAALRYAEEGTVTMSIIIDETGSVTGCKVTRSSESNALDEAGCRGMRDYAQYNPALDRNGNPTATVTSQSIRYVMPSSANTFTHARSIDEDEWRMKVFDTAFERELDDIDSKAAVFVLVIDESGNPTGCGMIISSGSADLDRRGCAALLEHARFEPVKLDDGTTTLGASIVAYPAQGAM